MNMIRAEVMNVKPFTSPSGQVKPVVDLKIDNAENKSISFINYNQIITNRIVAGTVLYFKDEIRPACIDSVIHPQHMSSFDLKNECIRCIPEKCPSCGSTIVKYKRNYWCQNPDCLATKEPRLKRILRYSPAYHFYNGRKVIQYARRNSGVSNSDFFNPDKISDLLPLLKESWLKYNPNTIRNAMIDSIASWSTADKLLCLESRIGEATVKKLVQDESIGIDIINRYTIRDMMAVGITQREASKIRTLIDLDYNQELIKDMLESNRFEKSEEEDVEE